MSQYARELSLIGEENFKKLRGASVAVFGIGGVGSYAAEALVRALDRVTETEIDLKNNANAAMSLQALFVGILEGR